MQDLTLLLPLLRYAARLDGRGRFDKQRVGRRIEGGRIQSWSVPYYFRTVADSSGGGNLVRNAGGTLKVGATEIALPSPGKLTLEEVDQWFAKTANDLTTINDLLKKEGMSARERAKRLNDWANELSAVGRLAMDDPNLAARLGLVLAPRDFLSLYRELGKTHSGDKLWDAVIEAKIKRTREMGCFVAGTLVHTQEGLKPIEQIKVGDLVLSKPENGEGELSYQPVTRIFQYEDREVFFVTWSALQQQTVGDGEPEWDYGQLAVTGGHPIWVQRLGRWVSGKKNASGNFAYTEVNGWMSIEEIYLGMWKQWHTLSKHGISVVHARLADGRTAEITRVRPILQSLGQAHIQMRDDLARGRLPSKPLFDEFLKIPEADVGVAFSDSEGWREEAMGDTIVFGPRGAYHSKNVKPMTAMWEVDTDDYDYTGYDTDSPMSVVKRSGGHLPMRRTVYNLEVANTHSYFVGELGLWVHNTSGVEAAKLPLNPALPLGANNRGRTTISPAFRPEIPGEARRCSISKDAASTAASFLDPGSMVVTL